MKFLIHIMRAYPARTLITLTALLIAGIVAGISLTALLPVLSLATDPEAAGEDNLLVRGLTAIGLSPTLGILLSVLVIGMALKSLITLYANRHVGYTVAQIATDLRLNLLRALLEARWDYYVHQPVGALGNSMATEAARAANAYLDGSRTVALLIETLVYVAVAMMVSWEATLVAMGFASLIIFGFGRLVRTSKRAGSRQTTLLRSLMSRMTDTLQSVKALKAMGLSARANLVLEGETGQLNKALRREVFSREALSSLYEPVIIAFTALGLFVAVTYYAVPLASILVLIILLVRVMSALGKVQRYYQKMVIDESAYWAMTATIERAEQAREACSGGRNPNFQREIVMNNVSLAFGEREVLRSLSLTLPSGSFTTIIGPSGSGKTTIIDIITGLLAPGAGQVLIDDAPLTECDIGLWRRMIGYVPQETLLLHDTVKHNVTLGDPDLSTADTERALRAAGAWEFVRANPEGINAIVGERGGKLSGGQRQRLCIARALVRQPRLLILDEATSALDPDSEAAICATLEALRGKITILAISHQTGLSSVADRVLRLEAGALLNAPEDSAALTTP
jgi:ATP-binding cassette, subfamily C, bacterial